MAANRNQKRNRIGNASLDRVATQRERACGFLSRRCGRNNQRRIENVSHIMNDITMLSVS